MRMVLLAGLLLLVGAWGPRQCEPVPRFEPHPGGGAPGVSPLTTPQYYDWQRR